MCPPLSSDDESDEDHDDVDADPSYDPAQIHFSRLQRLLQPREDDTADDEQEEDNEQNEDDEHNEDEPITDPEPQQNEEREEVSQKGNKEKKTKPPPPIWTEVSTLESEREPIIWKDLPPEYEEVNTPIDYFRQLVDDNLLDLLVEQSNLFAIQKNPNKPLNLTKLELEQFIGICLSMSVFGLPRARMYWADATRIDKIADIMSRNRWIEIKNNLHCNDNAGYDRNDPNRDRLYKIRPMVDHFQKKFREIPKEQHLCVDEQIVPYKGNSLLRQYNPKKPKKWGYKIFALCDTKGLIYDFEIYTGSIKAVDGFPDLGASSNIVLKLAETIPRDKNYLLFFDNWFSSLPLFF